MQFEAIGIKTGSVIVAYYPDQEKLCALVLSLSMQTELVCIVDNTPGCSQEWHEEVRGIPRTHLVVLKSNLGIAHAQNRGIEIMVNLRCGAIAIFDQDSSVGSNFIQLALSEASFVAPLLNKPIAVIGPNYQNENGADISPFVRVSFGRLTRIERKSELDRFCLPVFLIASGSIIFVDAIRGVGFMREELFIDYVDADWCLRAQAAGFCCVGLWNISMKHSIGEQSINILGRKISFHSPVRHYYLTRNAIYLYFHTNLPLSWKIADGISLVFKFALYSVLGLPELTHFRYMTKGFLDGLSRTMGAHKISQR